MKDQAAKKSALCVISNLPETMKRKMILDILESGKFVSVEWIVKSGKLSKMCCRVGVTKHLKHGKKCANGSSNTVAHLKQYKTVYKVNAGDKNGYRNLNLDTIVTIKCGGKIIHFSG